MKDNFLEAAGLQKSPCPGLVTVLQTDLHRSEQIHGKFLGDIVGEGRENALCRSF